MAFLNKGIKIIFKDERDGQKRNETYHYEGGIKEFVRFINRSKDSIHNDVIYFEIVKENCEVEVAMQYTEAATASSYLVMQTI